MLITNEGVIIRMPVSGISVQSRATQGVRLMKVDENCRIVCVARAEADDREDAAEAAEGATEADSADQADVETAVGTEANDDRAPDALDRLLDDLENDPEPEDDI